MARKGAWRIRAADKFEEKHLPSEQQKRQKKNVMRRMTRGLMTVWRSFKKEE